MTAAIEDVLREYASFVAPIGEDPELTALRTAILIEDACGVTLTDEQLNPSFLTDPGALRTFLARAQKPG